MTISTHKPGDLMGSWYLSKAPFIFKEGAYISVCDRFKNRWQRRTWLKDAGEKSEMSLNKDEKLTLTTQLPSLKNYSFSLDVGLDPQTLLPYAGASISYEFYDYKLETEHGTLTLNGTLTLKNTFTPYISNGLCEATIPISRGIDEANVIAYENKGTLATLMLSGTIFAFGSTIASTATAGVGALVMSAETAASPEQHQIKSKPAQSKDKTLIVNFSGYALSRSN